MEFDTISRLSDDELTAELTRLASCGRKTTVSEITHLMEFDARKLHLGMGFGSLFAYCTEVLRFSENETCNRIRAARAARKFPVILDLLRDGSVNLTTVRLLGRYLTPDNHAELLAEAGGKSKREIEKLIARRFPQPARPTLIRKVAAPKVTAAPSASPPKGEADAVLPLDTAPMPFPPSRPADNVKPLSPDDYYFRFTASADTHASFERAKELLSDAIPSGDTDAIIGRALALLVRDLEKKKFAATDRPRKSPGQAEGSRNIPAEVQREVWQRDGGRCAFVGKDGRRCEARRHLHYAHVKQPFATGGKPTAANIELRCRGHNQYEADLYFGPIRSGTDSQYVSPNPNGNCGLYGSRPTLTRISSMERGQEKESLPLGL